MKYKVGDKVRIREDLEVGSIYDGWAFNYIMTYLKGRKAIITKVNRGAYHIDLDDGFYSWTDGMLEPFKELNKEHFAKEIIEIATSDDNGCLAINKYTKELCKCSKTKCEDCLFRDDCRALRNKWANTEHVEPIKLTLAEKVILENLDSNFKWVARSDKNELMCFETKPTEFSGAWYGSNFRCLPCKQLFKFIKWKDGKLYKIEDILNNYEVVEDD